MPPKRKRRVEPPPPVVVEPTSTESTLEATAEALPPTPPNASTVAPPFSTPGAQGNINGSPGGERGGGGGRYVCLGHVLCRLDDTDTFDPSCVFPAEVFGPTVLGMVAPETAEASASPVATRLGCDSLCNAQRLVYVPDAPFARPDDGLLMNPGDDAPPTFVPLTSAPVAVPDSWRAGVRESSPDTHNNTTRRRSLRFAAFPAGEPRRTADGGPTEARLLDLLTIQRKCHDDVELAPEVAAAAAAISRRGDAAVVHRPGGVGTPYRLHPVNALSHPAPAR